jgi:hypothetical protein
MSSSSFKKPRYRLYNVLFRVSHRKLERKAAVRESVEPPENIGPSKGDLKRALFGDREQQVHADRS